ncbi:MAG: peptide deformylase [Candidatus Omnitrophota bacterium]|jgi:peptide deformylase
MQETGLKIKLFGERVLRGKARSVKEITGYHQGLLSSMARMMYELNGVGLAAPQVGVNQAIIVVDAGSGLYKLFNPKIIKKQGSQSMEEGCLSIPGVSIKVKRAKKVIVKALDESANPLTVEAEGLLACVFQHEIDHLNGKLIVDYASLFEKLKIKKKLAGLKRKAENEKLPESERQSAKLQL